VRVSFGAVRRFVLFFVYLAACSSASSPSDISDGGGSTNPGSSDGGDGGSSLADGALSNDAIAGGADAGVDSAPAVVYDDVAINFDELKSGTVVTSTYAPRVTFGSDVASLQVVAFDPTFVGQSKPNFICAGSRCDGGFVLTFAKPVEALHFNAVGVNSSSKAATIKVYESGTLTQTHDLVGKGNLSTPVPVDLSSAHSVTKVEVTDVTDFAGIGLDDFTFKVGR
jgi:hypothetical protein